ncbi:hypothetical protein Esti_003585 [Eimeria stiedai]
MGPLRALRVWAYLLAAAAAAAVAARSFPPQTSAKPAAATPTTALKADSPPPASAKPAAPAAAAPAATGVKGLIGTALLQDTENFGWQHPENQQVRHYVCQWCVAQWVHCNGLLKYPNWSYGLCTCEKYGHNCVDNSVCRQEDAPLGGAYCVCKDGYVGDGTYCYEDKCRSQPCYPGTCVLVNEEVKCNCPEYYEVDRSKMPQGCKVKDMCKDSPCGDTKSTKTCYHEGPGRYSCECNLGYVAVEVNGKILCDDVFNHFVCASSPCGATGVQECLDTASGVKCTCMPGYKLVKETARYSCIREDPCLSSPCGTTDIVSSCVATSASYVCTCKEGYKVVPGEKGQYCAFAEAETNYVLYAGIGGGVLVLLFAVFACNYMRRGPELTEEEVQFMQQNGGDGVSDVAIFNTSESWQ